MSKTITASFVLPATLKAMLEQWAKTEDRTQSATLRIILEAEAARRNRHKEEKNETA
jgi:hypothetical protein